MSKTFTQLFLGLTLSLACTVAQAQAFKCKTPDGKSFFSDTGCPSQSSVQSVRQSEYVSTERQRQAQEVNDRRASELHGIDNEKAAFNESLRQQQQAAAAEDARQAVIQSRQQGTDNLRRQRDECDQLATNKNMPRSHRAALAEICAKPEPDNQRFNDCKEQIAKAGNPSQRATIASNCTGDANAGARVREVSRPPPPPPGPSIITSCDGGGCWDNRGNRYNGSGQTMFRSDGKACTRVGTQLQCN